MANSIGRVLNDSRPAQEIRKDAGVSATQDNVRSNAPTQRDGTPTNLGSAPTNPRGFFKSGKDHTSSGLERAAGALADKLHKK